MTAVLDRLRLASAVITGSAVAASIIPTRTFQISRGPLELFVWPDESGLDDWGKLEVRKLRREVEERYTRYHSFDICSLRDFMQNMCIPLTAQTKDSFERLHRLHCVQFSGVPASIYERIPHWFNHVISCGQITHPLIASGVVIDV
ncbi:hypothetical protein GCM10027082_23920 [Comamonas humi]